MMTDKSQIKNWAFTSEYFKYSITNSIKVINVTDELLSLYLLLPGTYFIIYDIEDESDEKTELLIDKLKQYIKF